jgi:DNA invertase Pin-like site-specific DNA recombinase
MMSSMSEWDVLLVLKMDRIHRDIMNFLIMMALLKKNNKEFNSVQDKFDTTTAMGRFVMNIMQCIAQLESEQIGERVKMGMMRKAELGTGMLGSGHPYGYVYGNGSLHIEPDEARTVRMIYRMHSDGLSTEKIAKNLNEDGIPAKRGGKWNKQSIHKILRNPLYIGKMRWDGMIRDSIHEAIIDPEEFGTDGGSHA